MKYFEWEGAVIEAVAESMAISHSDAAGVVEAQPFYMQQSWGKGMDAQLTAAKVIEAAVGQAQERAPAPKQVCLSCDRCSTRHSTARSYSTAGVHYTLCDPCREEFDRPATPDRPRDPRDISPDWLF